MNISELIIVFAIGFIAASILCFNDINNKEEKYIMNASCDGLQIYINAFDEDRKLFAYWTYQTQETINFNITEKNVEIARDVFENRLC